MRACGVSLAVLGLVASGCGLVASGRLEGLEGTAWLGGRCARVRTGAPSGFAALAEALLAGGEDARAIPRFRPEDARPAPEPVARPPVPPGAPYPPPRPPARSAKPLKVRLLELKIGPGDVGFEFEGEMSRDYADWEGRGLGEYIRMSGPVFRMSLLLGPAAPVRLFADASATHTYAERPYDDYWDYSMILANDEDQEVVWSTYGVMFGGRTATGPYLKLGATMLDMPSIYRREPGITGGQVNRIYEGGIYRGSMVGLGLNLSLGRLRLFMEYEKGFMGDLELSDFAETHPAWSDDWGDRDFDLEGFVFGFRFLF